MNESARSVTALGFALVLSAVAFNLVLTESLGVFFDLVFVSTCVLLAWVVRLEDFYRVTILPPLLMAGTFLLIAAVAPELIARADDNVLQALLSGLSDHALALVAGYALALGTIWWRLRQDHHVHVDPMAELGDTSEFVIPRTGPGHQRRGA
ncbi:MAG: DUF6542 domain-containing protein [Nocardioides sp.]|jgi:hypothetical protein